MSSGSDAADLCATPNQHAEPFRIERAGAGIKVSGYQRFELTKDAIVPDPADVYLTAKSRLISPFFQPRFMHGRTVLDLGSNAGFFLYWAATAGATEAHGVDIDKEYNSGARGLSQALGYERVHIHEKNVVDWKQPHDVVLALGLIHWIITCTARLGTLENAIAWLRRLTKYVLIVEWVEPNDQAIEFFGHLSWGGHRPAGPVTLAAFEAALRRNFARVERLGQVRETRAIYAAYCNEFENDLTTPLPYLHDPSTVLASRLLATIDGQAYWSRVYILPNRVVKQTTGGLALREWETLKKLQGRRGFPTPLKFEGSDGFEVVELERVNGAEVSTIPPARRKDRDFAIRFAKECLRILSALQGQGIQHRDIRAENVLVDGDRPILIDFGWASFADTPALQPAGLGAEGRAPDGISDVYSTGLLLRTLFGNDHPEIRIVAALMTAANPSRVHDPEDLVQFLDDVANLPETARTGWLSVIETALQERATALAAISNLNAALATITSRLNAQTEAGSALQSQLAEARAKTLQLQSEVSRLQAELGKVAAEAAAANALLDEIRGSAMWRANSTISRFFERLDPTGTRGAKRLRRTLERLRGGGKP